MCYVTVDLLILLDERQRLVKLFVIACGFMQLFAMLGICLQYVMLVHQENDVDLLMSLRRCLNFMQF